MIENDEARGIPGERGKPKTLEPGKGYNSEPHEPGPLNPKPQAHESSRQTLKCKEEA